MKRISGLDLNGWKDVAARDWNAEDGERSEFVTTLAGGIGGIAVKLKSGKWVGGPQAVLAPHGRGGGWGELGAPDRRVSFAESDESGTLCAVRFPEAYAASASALSHKAQEIILAVPDIPTFDEEAQGNVLRVFNKSRRPIRLLWKPIALFLHALDRGLISKDAEGARFRFLIHSADGIEVQILRLRKDNQHVGHVAPEREGYGHVVLPQFGLRSLKEIVQQVVRNANPILAAEPTERSVLPLKLLLDEATADKAEILRHDNGGWIKIIPPTLDPSDLFPRAAESELRPINDGPIDASFFVSSLIEEYSARLAAALRSSFGNLIRLEADGIARGSLLAGRLIERGLPHYFDRLTPISLAVLQGRQPEFIDLVGASATLPANKEYASPPYRDLKWLRGKREIDFYVMKGDREIRHWTVRMPTPPDEDVDIELRFRQTPGQSWAKLFLTSPNWESLSRSPIYLDWANLNALEDTPEEILGMLSKPPPTIPKRVIEGPSMEFWIGSDRLVPMLDPLVEMDEQGVFDFEIVARLLSRSNRNLQNNAREWPVGTDGTLPLALPESGKRALKSVIRASEDKILKARRALSDNHALRCLTWVYTLCPETVQNALVEALESNHRGRRHPFLAPAAALTVVTQGAGRALTGSGRLRRALEVLSSRPPNNSTINAIAMILSRRAEAPQALSSALMRKIALLVSNELVDLTKNLSFKTRFKNTLSAIAGLFRYREVEPYALLASEDEIAMDISETLEKASSLLHRNQRHVRQFAAKMDTLSSIKDYLQGEGDPNILIRIENLEEE